jgi:multicomponent Na+:H+ antiporter subunit G
MADLLSWLLLIGGCVFALAGGVGVLRFPDLYTRLHAAGMTDTMAAALILLGLLVQAGWSLISVKLLLVLAFLLFTSPVASHALARAAMAGGVRPDCPEIDSSKP